MKFLPKDKTALLVVLIGMGMMIWWWWYPVIRVFILGFKQAGLMYLEETWLGLDNFKELFNSKIFKKVIANTLYYTLLTVPAQMVLGLLISMSIDKIRNRVFRRTSVLSFYAPYVLPIVAVGIVWKFLYHPSGFGMFNFLLGKIGAKEISWLQDSRTALPAIAIMVVWKRVGYVIILYLAGLQAIPKVYYEAAEIDGANVWRKFRSITLPLLSSTTLFIIVTSTINAFLMFEPTYIMTLTESAGRGGPDNATNVMMYYVYSNAFGNDRLGYASAAVTILFFMVLGVTFLQFRFIRTRFEY
jgi:multiple sugar transport system permease protein